MDSKLSFIKKVPLFLVLTGSSLGLMIYLSMTFSYGKPHGKKGAEQGVLSHLVDVYAQAWVQAQAKADAIREVDEENTKLRLENATLRTQIETDRFDSHIQSGEEKTHHHQEHLRSEAGDSVGRIPASINYKVPSQLPPSQLYTLGVTYLKAQEYEKASSIFTNLMTQNKDTRFRTTKNLLMTGVAWYHVENYVLADRYFEESLKLPETEDSVEDQTQAKVWRALVAKKLNKEFKSQYWLRELLDQHPHSHEASLINPGSKKSQDDENQDDEVEGEEESESEPVTKNKKEAKNETENDNSEENSETESNDQ